MTLADPPLVSPQDAHRLAEEAGIEFVGGQIVAKPVSIESSRIGIRIGMLLGIEAVASGQAEVYDSSLGYKVFPDDPEKFRKPDVSVVRADRLAGLDLSDGFMRIPADLVVEVLSPGDLAYDVAAKVDEYLRYNFPTVWVVQPNTRSINVYRSDGTNALLRGDAVITCQDVLPGFRCQVSEFFKRSVDARTNSGDGLR
jgi:Uma2 family endonuclease